MSNEMRRVAAAGCALGEGPVWLAEKQTLLFTDIIGRAILRWRALDGLSRVAVGARVGAFAPIDGGPDLLAISEQGVWHMTVEFDKDAVQRRPFSDGLDAVIPAEAIMNDGMCDPAGRFVCGAKALDEATAMAPMLSVDGAAVAPLGEGFIVFNGPAFSPSGDRIYFADSPTKEIRTAAYDLATGRLGPVELFARLEADAGYPDGMAVDAEGCLWNAHWDGWRITRYRADGAVDRVIKAPVSRPTSLAFGGPGMKTLFVTSAQRGRDDAPPSTEPGAGDLFAVDVDVAGAPVAAFRHPGARPS